MSARVFPTGGPARHSISRAEIFTTRVRIAALPAVESLSYFFRITGAIRPPTLPHATTRSRSRSRFSTVLIPKPFAVRSVARATVALPARWPPRSTSSPTWRTDPMTLSPEVEVTRAVVLHETSTAITKLRESQNLAPLDDPIPGAPPNAFQMIHAILNEFSAPAGESHVRGLNRGQNLSE